MDDFRRGLEKQMGSFRWKQVAGMPLWFFIVLLIFLLPQMFTIIEPGHRGVSVTLGKIDKNVRGEGLLFKMPFIEQIYKYSVQQKTVSGLAECYSSDLQTVNVAYNTFYELLPDKVVLLHQHYQGDPYKSMVEPLIQDAMKQVIALYRAEDAVKQREAVRQKATDRVRVTLQKIAAEKTKDKNTSDLVRVVNLPITNIELTEALEHAIERKQITEQEAAQKKYELLKAQKQAEITLVAASADAKALKVKSDAIRSAPKILDLEMKKLDLEMTAKILKKWDGKSPQTVVSGKNQNTLLPLP